MDISLQREFNNINTLINISNKEKNILENQINNQNFQINNNNQLQIYKNINTILNSICNQISIQFKIDINLINSIYNTHKIKLTNDYEESEQENSINSDSDSDSESTQLDKNISTDIPKKPICIPVNIPNKPIKCPANKGNNGQLCGRMTIKTTNFTYCGYHKKYFKP